jgi:hypothetical protein
MKGFPNIWNNMVMKVVKEGRVAIKVNDENGPYFPTYQGLRQGDPLSPILFYLIANVLAIMINRAVEQGLITGLASKYLEGLFQYLVKEFSGEKKKHFIGWCCCCYLGNLEGKEPGLL